MLRHYFKIALRTLTRHRLFATINIVGLGLGMACCLLILLFIRHELSYDRHLPDADRIYRVTYHTSTDIDLARIPPPIAQHLPAFFSEVETAARAFSGNMTIRVPAASTGQPDRDFEEEQVYFVDSTFTDIFPLTFVYGDPTQRLAQPNTVLLNEEVAARYFGDTDPIGRTIIVEGEYLFTVTGVVNGFPPNTHLHFNLLMPYDNMFGVLGEEAESATRQNLGSNWIISHSYTYVKLKPGASPQAFGERSADLVAQHAPPNHQVGQAFSLMPLPDIHLHSAEVYLQPEAQGDIRYIYIFAAIAFLTLLLPCFNFINLATAQSIGRTMEIGVRQAMGAYRHQLFGQFLGESLVICTLAFGLALILTLLGLPLLSDLVQRDLPAALLLDPLVIGGFVLVLVLTGLLGGAYPAFLIARTNIVAALRRKVAAVPGGRLSLRKVLVTLQFAISISLIGGTVLIFSQLDYLLSRPLGFQTEAVIAVPLFSQNMNNFFSGVDGEMRSTLNTFEETIAQHPAVQASTLSRNAPGLGVITRGVYLEGRPAEEATFVPTMAVDYDFLDFYGLTLAAGRGFDRDRGTDHLNAFIINETAAREFGWGAPAEALGKTLTLEGKEGEVIGVVRDFNYLSLRNPIGAMLLEINVQMFETMSIRLASERFEETLAYLGEQWQAFFPDQAFDYAFLDETLESQYDAQQRLGGMLRLFALLGIVISCLGAYGLVMYNARQRRREVGVRKVLGASLPNILTLFYREMTLLFLIGLVLAAPVIYLTGQWWLEDFTYRVAIKPWVFVLSGGVMLALAWLTISYQAIKAARVNPVECLRTE